MSFKLEQQQIDLGTTSIENIFINDFMPSANGTYVKVYLLGYKIACDQDEEMTLDNKALSSILQIPIDDVLQAWDFWETRNIITKTQYGDNLSDFDVEFLSLRQLYIQSNYVEKSQIKSYSASDYRSSKDDLIEANRSPIVKEMFYKLDQIVRRQLVPNERLVILEWMEKFNMDPDIIVEAFTYSVEVRNVKNVKYVSAILRDWYDKGLITKELVQEHFNNNNIHYKNYQRIYKILGYGTKSPSLGDIEIMDIWLKSWELPMDFLEKALIDASKKTSNINMNYMHKIVSILYEKNVRSLESYVVYLATVTEKNKRPNSNTSATNKQTKRTNNKSHNFLDRGNVYSNDELEKKLGIKK